MLGLTFRIEDAVPPRPSVTNTGTAFLVGAVEKDEADDGPFYSASLSTWVANYGDRVSAEPELYDAVEAFFREGGGSLWTLGIVFGVGTTDQEIEDALADLPIDLGPGQVAAPGRTSTDVHSALLAHAAATNRRAILDLPNTSDSASLVTAAEALDVDENRRFGGVWGNHLTAPGVTPSSTRTIAPSGVMCGLIARSDRTRSPNEAAAGLHIEPRWVTGVAEEFDRATVDTLAEANVNVFATRFGRFQNYGFRSLADSDDHPAWSQLTSSRLVMAIIAQALHVSARFLFAQFDGRRVKLSDYENSLIADAFMPYWSADSLFGETAEEAFSVDATSTEANSDASIAAGNIRAVCSIRPSPFAESIEFVITNVPADQPLAA